MVEAGIDAIPFSHLELEIWRNNFEGIRNPHAANGFYLYGVLDDVWQGWEMGCLFVVDYKAKAKDSQVSLDAEWLDGYKHQIEFYKWPLRHRGFQVNSTAWFVYANGCKDTRDSMPSSTFGSIFWPHKGSDEWVEEGLLEAILLDLERAPERMIDAPTAHMPLVNPELEPNPENKNNVPKTT